MSGQDAVAQTPEWKQKQIDAAERVKRQQRELDAKAQDQLQLLLNNTPSHMTAANGTTFFLTEAERALVMSYAFIGLATLVSGTSGMPITEIFAGCIKQAIVVMKKESLLL